MPRLGAGPEPGVALRLALVKVLDSAARESGATAPAPSRRVAAEPEVPCFFLGCQLYVWVDRGWDWIGLSWSL